MNHLMEALSLIPIRCPRKPYTRGALQKAAGEELAEKAKQEAVEAAKKEWKKV
jgi:hypothetical protein